MASCLESQALTLAQVERVGSSPPPYAIMPWPFLAHSAAASSGIQPKQPSQALPRRILEDRWLLNGDVPASPCKAWHPANLSLVACLVTQAVAKRSSRLREMTEGNTSQVSQLKQKQLHRPDAGSIHHGTGPWHHSGHHCALSGAAHPFQREALTTPQAQTLVQTGLH